jgi:hypothetical protein
MENFPIIYEERVKILEELTEKLSIIESNKQTKNFLLLKELMKQILLEKKKEILRIIKEDSFLENFFLIKALSQENKR